MPGQGIDMVLPSDYDKLVVKRQTELKHIEERLQRLERDMSLTGYEMEAYQGMRDLIGYVRAIMPCDQPGKEIISCTYS